MEVWTLFFTPNRSGRSQLALKIRQIEVVATRIENPLKKNPVFEENEITKQPREIFPLASLEKYGADAVENKDSHNKGEFAYLNIY